MFSGIGMTCEDEGGARADFTPPPPPKKFKAAAVELDDTASKKCKCNLPAKRCVAGPNAKPENRGRAFFACPRPKDLGCKFFEFEDAAPSAGAASAGGAAAAEIVISKKWAPPTGIRPTMPASKQDALRLLNLYITEEQALTIRNAEQRSQAWHDGRKFRITGSIMGSITGHNKYQTTQALLKELLWGTFKGNAATRFGTFYEPEACKAYEMIECKKWGQRYKQVNGVSMPMEMPFYVEHTGLIINPETPYIGVSPDGISHNVLDHNMQPMTVLLEIKCPATGIPYDQQDAYKKVLYPGVPIGIPPQYYDQIQGLMHFLNLPAADFCVYVGAGTDQAKAHVVRYPYDATYCKTVIVPAIDKFFFEEYVPAIILKQAGKLDDGDIEESIHV